MEKVKKESKEIITKLWKGSGENYVLKIPCKEIDTNILELDRNVKLTPKPRMKGYLLTNIK